MADIKWTVSILLQYYKEDDYAYKLLKDTIKKQANHAIVKYYIFLHDILYDKAQVFTIDESSGSAEWKATGPIFPCKDLFSDPGKYWNPFFNDHAVKDAARHNIVVTSGHGAGFGFVTRDKLRETKRPFSKWKKKRKILSYLKGAFSTGLAKYDKDRIIDILLDGSNFSEVKRRNFFKRNILKTGFDIIPVSALDEILANCFKSGKVDFLYLMNCYMQLHESGLCLVNSTRYVVASEGFVYPTGIDFDKLFSEMGNQVEGDPHLASLMNNITVNLPIKYSGPFLLFLKKVITGFETKSVKFISISINDIGKYQLVDKLLEKLGAFFTANTNLYPEIKKVRDDCPDISPNPYGITDVVNFCKELYNLTKNAPLKLICDDIIQLITKKDSDVIKGSYFPKEAYDPTLDPDFAICPYGMTVFFPRDRKKSLKDQYITFFMDNFYATNPSPSAWQKFVIDYFNHKF